MFVAGTTLYEGDSFHGLVRLIDLSTGIETRGPPSFSGHGVTGAVTDPGGDIFLADPGQNAIYKSPASGGPLVNVFQAGPAATGFPNLALGTDMAGNVYVAIPYQQRTNSNEVFRIDPNGGPGTLVAGTLVSYGGLGDGGPATSATLSNPLGVSGDAAGNLYIADSSDNRIRRVAPTGIITTFAGTGAVGFTGDGGPASAADLSDPQGVWADAIGDVFIADTGNNRVRKVLPSGVITTVAGTGAAGFAGDGGAATAALLSSPRAVTLDRTGNLVFVDTGNLRLRSVSATDGTITTIAGDGDVFVDDGGTAVGTPLWQPYFLAFGASSTVFLTDSEPQVSTGGGAQAREVDASGSISVFARAGYPAPAATFSVTTGVAVDASGAVYVADSNANVVIKVGPGATAAVYAGGGTTLGDGGPATAAQLASPFGLALDSSGNLYIADYGNQRIRRVTPAGVISTVAGDGVQGFSGDGGPATAAELNSPQDVAVAPNGTLYIADSQNQRLRQVELDGTIATAVLAGVVVNAAAVAPDGSIYYTGEDEEVHRLAGDTVTVVAGTGTPGFSGDGGPAVAAELNHPFGIAVDSCGAVIIVDSGNNRVRRIG